MNGAQSFATESRQDGYQLALPDISFIKERILGAFQSHPEGLTAEEACQVAEFDPSIPGHLNTVRSRITELKTIGKLIEIGRRKSPRTGVNITVLRLVS